MWRFSSFASVVVCAAMMMNSSYSSRLCSAFLFRHQTCRHHRSIGFWGQGNIDVSTSRSLINDDDSTATIHLFSIERKRRVVLPSSLSSSGTALAMNKKGGFFGGFFRSFTADGGSYNLQIDYDSLPFPCPELATMAMEQQQQTKTVAVTTSPSRPDLQLATFAGGCFWGLELAFQRVKGVEYTAVGYTQGREACPNYEQVSAGNTGHTEAVVVYFDPKVISYSQLCRIFLDRIDPTTQNGQGRDYGRQYRTGIYTHSPEQDDIARSLLQQEQNKYDKRPIATECRTAMPFWPAEAYHQQYLEKGGRFGSPQSAEKGCTDEIRCYG